MLTLISSPATSDPPDALPSEPTCEARQESNDPQEFALAEGINELEALACLLGLWEPDALEWEAEQPPVALTPAA